MELFEAIRREYQFGVGTVKGVARKFGDAPAHGAGSAGRRGAERTKDKSRGRGRNWSRRFRSSTRFWRAI